MNENPRRKRERLRLALPLRVRCLESLDYEWMEMTRLMDVSPLGAGFTISRPTEPGRLLHLTLPLPRQLRCFDHVEDQYRIWSLVRHTAPLAQMSDKRLGFRVGVAFIGKRTPSSYERDPATRYEIASSGIEGDLWHARERSSRPQSGDSSREGPATRLSIPLDVLLEPIEMGQSINRETTVTENISLCGACVYTSLKVEKGRFVRLTSAQHRTSVIAVVRGRRTGHDGMTRLHLEFIDRRWPLEGIEGE